MADKIDAILVKLGQPSGPAPLKRWLETLNARDGVQPRAVAEPGVMSDPSIAVELGSQDLELQEVRQEAPPTVVEEDRGTGAETRPLIARTRAEPPPLGGPTRLLADLSDLAAHDAPTKPRVGVRFKRWARRMTIRAALLLVLAGGALYLVHPFLPAWARQPIDSWLRRLPAPLGSPEGAR
jgi:hypothetical protein